MYNQEKAKNNYLKTKKVQKTVKNPKKTKNSKKSKSDSLYVISGRDVI